MSADGHTFTKVASGSWPVSWSTKLVTWPARADTRFVRLEAVAGVENLASAAEINVMLASGLR